MDLSPTPAVVVPDVLVSPTNRIGAATEENQEDYSIGIDSSVSERYSLRIVQTAKNDGAYRTLLEALDQRQYILSHHITLAWIQGRPTLSNGSHPHFPANCSSFEKVIFQYARERNLDLRNNFREYLLAIFKQFVIRNAYGLDLYRDEYRETWPLN